MFVNYWEFLLIYVRYFDLNVKLIFEISMSIMLVYIKNYVI